VFITNRPEINVARPTKPQLISPRLAASNKIISWPGGFRIEPRFNTNHKYGGRTILPFLVRRAWDIVIVPVACIFEWTKRRAAAIRRKRLRGVVSFE